MATRRSLTVLIQLGFFCGTRATRSVVAMMVRAFYGPTNVLTNASASAGVLGLAFFSLCG